MFQLKRIHVEMYALERYKKGQNSMQNLRNDAEERKEGDDNAKEEYYLAIMFLKLALARKI